MCEVGGGRVLGYSRGGAALLVAAWRRGSWRRRTAPAALGHPCPLCRHLPLLIRTKPLIRLRLPAGRLRARRACLLTSLPLLLPAAARRLTVAGGGFALPSSLLLVSRSARLPPLVAPVVAAGGRARWCRPAALGRRAAAAAAGRPAPVAALVASPPAGRRAWVRGARRGRRVREAGAEWTRAKSATALGAPILAATRALSLRGGPNCMPRRALANWLTRGPGVLQAPVAALERQFKYSVRPRERKMTQERSASWAPAQHARRATAAAQRRMWAPLVAGGLRHSACLRDW